MPSKSAKSCFVSNCNSIYPSCKVKVPLFRAPPSVWKSRNIKRADRTLDSAFVACAKHFEKQYMEKTFKHIVMGELDEIQRDRPLLRNNAGYNSGMFVPQPRDISEHRLIRTILRNGALQIRPP